MSCFSLSCLPRVPHSGPILSLSLTCITLTLLKTIDQLLFTVFFNLHFFHVSALLDSSCTFWQEYHISNPMFFLSHAIRWHRFWFFHFCYLNEMVSAMLLHSKVFLFPFVFNKHCGKLLWNCIYIYPLSNFQFIHWLICVRNTYGFHFIQWIIICYHHCLFW